VVGTAGAVPKPVVRVAQAAVEAGSPLRLVEPQLRAKVALAAPVRRVHQMWVAAAEAAKAVLVGLALARMVALAGRTAQAFTPTAQPLGLASDSSQAAAVVDNRATRAQRTGPVEQAVAAVAPTVEKPSPRRPPIRAAAAVVGAKTKMVLPVALVS